MITVQHCVAQASAAYGVPVPAIERVLDRHASGGIGPMNIPATWLPVLAKIGFLRATVRDDRCTNIEAGAWIMAYEQMQGRAQKAVPAAGSNAARLAPPGVGERGGSPFPLGGACVASAASHYRIPVVLYRAVLATEGGRIGEIHDNSNGTYDMGPAQINSSWLPALAKAGISRAQLLDDGCLNISVGAWILAQAMKGADTSDPAQWWSHVGDYNSHTPSWNRLYQVKVWSHLEEEANAGP